MSIIINGGGLLGSILALMLAKLTKGDLKIFLIEQYSPYYYDENQLISNIPHAIALSRGAYYELLHMMNNMNSILSSCSTIIRQVEISEYGKFNKIIINAQDYQLSELGYVLESNTFRKKLFDLLSKQSTITIYCPASLKQIEYEKTANVVVLNNGKKIVANLMVAADGMYSVLATHCGIKWFRRNYQQIAVVTTVFTEFPPCGWAFERFTEFGLLALLPISNDSSFLIWCISNQKKKEIAAWDKNKFSQELQNIFGWKLGKILDIGPRYFYDLWLTRARSHIAHRLALVGNAAQNLHPIAGQGFNLGLRDVIVLSRIITEAFYQKIDIGDYSILNTYKKLRFLDQYKIIKATDGLIRLFNNHCVPLIITRNLALCCINYSSFLQRLLVNALLHWKIN